MQNGQVVQAVIDYRVRKFTVAEVLFEDDNRDLVCGHSGIPRDATRWRELLIVRTAKSAIAIRDAYRTRWQGEHDSNAWTLAASEEEAGKLLATFAGGADAGDGFSVEPTLAKRALKELGWWDQVAEEV